LEGTYHGAWYNGTDDFASESPYHAWWYRCVIADIREQVRPRKAPFHHHEW